jgi:type I restriction enzyme S subunit
MAEWLEEPLSEVLDFREGPGILAKDFRTDGVPLIRLAGVKSRDSILTGCNYLDPKMVDSKWSHFRLAEDDVVLSTSASLGEVTVVDSDGVGCIPYTGLIRFRSIDERRVLQRFIPLALTSSTFKAQIQAMGAGSVLKHFGPMHLRQMTLRLPPVPVQAAIADLIESIDDRTESCRRQVALLEALGSAHLDSALPVDAFGQPEYADVRLGEFLDVLETGSRPRGGVSADTEGVVSLGAENVQSAGIVTSRAFKRVPTGFAERMRRGVLIDDDVLVYKDGGKPGNFVPHVSAFGHKFPVGAATINEHVYRVRAVPEIGQGLLYWILRSPWMDQEMRKRGTGVAIPGLNSTNFKELPFPRLTETDRDLLRDPLTAALRSMLRCGAEIAVLDDLRDAVLSGLLTGELEIGDVKAAIA